MTRVPSAVEILPQFSTGWLGCTSVTDDIRQQTDERATAFAKTVSPVNSTEKNLIKWSPSNPSHLNHVATLPCDWLSLITMQCYLHKATRCARYWKYTLCLKNVPPLTCYNLYTHCPITTTLIGANVTKKVGNPNVLYFPTYLTSALALPRETGNPQIASFHLNVFFTKNTQNTLKISTGYSWTTLYCQNDRLGAPDRT